LSVVKIYAVLLGDASQISRQVSYSENKYTQIQLQIFIN